MLLQGEPDKDIGLRGFSRRSRGIMKIRQIVGKLENLVDGEKEIRSWTILLKGRNRGAWVV